MMTVIENGSAKIKAMKIKIIHCIAFGPQFENLKDGSEHDVIKEYYGRHPGRAKKGRKHLAGYWIQGVGQPVVVLNGEFEIIET
jgi:hypothetical protein